jgi:hypothetical protein
VQHDRDKMRPIDRLRIQEPLRSGHGLLAPIPPNWSYQELGLFCKLDVQLERRLKMPVLLRLGDAQLVEVWEGKGPLRLPMMVH